VQSGLYLKKRFAYSLTSIWYTLSGRFIMICQIQDQILFLSLSFTK
jgi:hypothetical protein